MRFRVLALAGLTLLGGCQSWRSWRDSKAERAPAPAPVQAPAPPPVAQAPAPSAQRFLITPMNPLETALVDVAREPSPAHQQAFTQAFLSSTVYLRTSKEGAANPNGPLVVWRAPTPAGQSAMVLFTSEARLRQAFPNDGQLYWLAMPGRQALESGKSLPIILNWGIDPAISWSAAQAEALRTAAP